MTPFRAEAIGGFRLGAGDVAAACAFLVDALDALPQDEASGERRLRVGDATVIVGEGAGVQGAHLPANAAGFQHLAVVVSDIEAVQARALRHGASPITRGGPQRLPASSGGVTAWKFRAPGGQPLELLQTPTQAWSDRARSSDALVLGIDHTALGCSDLEATLAFYEALGFTRGPPSHNVGPEQDRLDGLDGVDLHIATLFTAGAGPHIELLHYAAPAAGRASGRSDVAILLPGRGGAGRIEGPDGHALIAEPLSSGPRADPWASR